MGLIRWRKDERTGPKEHHQRSHKSVRCTKHSHKERASKRVISVGLITKPENVRKWSSWSELSQTGKREACKCFTFILVSKQHLCEAKCGNKRKEADGTLNWRCLQGQDTFLRNPDSVGSRTTMSSERRWDWAWAKVKDHQGFAQCWLQRPPLKILVLSWEWVCSDFWLDSSCRRAQLLQDLLGQSRCHSPRIRCSFKGETDWSWHPKNPLNLRGSREKARQREQNRRGDGDPFTASPMASSASGPGGVAAWPTQPPITSTYMVPGPSQNSQLTHSPSAALWPGPQLSAP